MTYKALIGDVSAGTTRFALLNLSGADIVERKLPSFEIERVCTEGIANLSKDVIESYLDKNGLTTKNIMYGVFAPAGVIDGDGTRCKLTNGELELNVADFGFPALLVNDFVAKGKFVSAETKNGNLKYISLREGISLDKSPIIVAGVGSGYGVCVLDWDDHRKEHIPRHTELSHGPLAIDLGDTENPAEYKIFDALRRRLETRILSWEDFLSTKKGGGIEKTFEVINELKGLRLPDDYLNAESKATWIHVNARNANPGSVLYRINQLEWNMIGRSLRAFGTGNVAKGGIYLSSGMAQNNLIIDGEKDNVDERLVKYIEEGFVGYSTYNDWPREIPLRLILESDDGLKGAGYFAIDAIREKILC